MFGAFVLSVTSILAFVSSQSYFYGDYQTESADQIEYTLELFIVVDHSAYLKWYEKTSGATRSARENNTLYAIYEHYASVMHGIHTVYRDLEDGGMGISIKPVDIQVITSKGIVDSRGKVLASEKALSKFFKWTQVTSPLPSFDHAILVTGYDLSDNGDIKKSGRAYLGTMCSSRSLSVVENDFSYEIVSITSHELGHSLGAHHDGEGNSCRKSDGYLMASVIKANSTNRWDFSPCSITYIRDQIDQLTSRDQNCLLDTNWDIAFEYGIPMGELYTADQQCLLIEGSGSYVCREFYGGAYDSLCSNLWCHSAVGKKNLCNSHEGSDGFMCGDMRVCSKGHCVEDYNAPYVLDSCPQGDHPGIVWKNYTCTDVVHYEPEMCYDNTTRARCCMACLEIQTDDPDCPYGDKSSWCRTDLEAPMSCYNNEDLCCRTCKMYQDHSKPNCTYGDKSLWCERKLVAPYDCYQNADLCCATCEKLYNASRPGCEYGDKSVWCAKTLNPPYDCYKNEDLCCSTCPPYKNEANKGCEYGDQSKWCETDLEKPYGCYLNIDFCCGTCRQFLNTSQVDCEYGDKHKDCETLDYPTGCYNNEKICCRSCPGLKDSTKVGCEYGDKSTWCTKSLNPVADCPLNLDLCCATCDAAGSGDGPL